MYRILIAWHILICGLTALVVILSRCSQMQCGGVRDTVHGAETETPIAYGVPGTMLESWGSPPTPL